MAIKQTTRYRLTYFDNYQFYNYRADWLRFQTIENQLEAALSITGGGVLRGWDVSATDPNGSPFSITISPGSGIIPFLVNSFIVDDEVGKVDRVRNPEKETKYIGVRTNEDRILASLGSNRISIIYVGLSEEIADTINNPSEINTPVEIWRSSSISVFVLPESGDAPGAEGPYRNTRPIQSSFPIYQYEILGRYNQSENDIRIFVNGNPFLDNFTQQGNKIIFKFPLQSEDVVTVRLQPKFSLPIAEVETDQNGIVRIDNGIKPQVFNLDGDSIVFKTLIEHVHDGLEKSPEKILLSTETKNISYSSSLNNIIYYFEKQEIIDKYDFDFGKDDFGILNYIPTIYINGLQNIDPVTIEDNGAQIIVTFEDSLEDSDIVQVCLRIKENYTQIKNKIVSNETNPSEDILDISVDATNIKEGILDPNLIPTISHVGIYREALKPVNDENKNSVHRTESPDFIEYFPVLNDKNNARNALFLFTESNSEKTTTGSTKIYACGGNTALFTELDDILDENNNVRWPISSSNKLNFFKGWDAIEYERVFGTGGNNKKFNEFGRPFDISPVKISGDSNWDFLFFTSEKFVYSLNFINEKLIVREIANLTPDNRSAESTLQSIGSTITKATSSKGLLNIQRGQFLLIDDKVAMLDIKDGKFNWWNISTNAPLWDSTFSITNFYDGSDFENNILFVGSETDGDFDCYINSLAYIRLQNNIEPSVQQGRVITNFSASPSTVWDYSDDDSTPFNTGDDVIFATYNGVSERRQIFSANQSVINMPAEGGVSRLYEGIKNNLYNSVMLRDWVKFSEGLDSSVIKVLYYENRIIVITSNNIYATSATYTINEVNYLINSISTPLSPGSGLVLIHAEINGNFNDAISFEGGILIASDEGIYKLSISDYSTPSYTFVLSQNSVEEYGESLNALLAPANRLFYDENTSSDNSSVIYACTKYGIFKSKDGNTWRNTLQIIGQPESIKSNYISPKNRVKVIQADKDKNRIYVVNESGQYGYGYGYGGSMDYFNVFNIDGSNYGYAFDLDGMYGYGYGFETFSPIIGVESNDWIFTDDGSGNNYDGVPIRILGLGTENNAYYLDIELGNGDPVNFDYIFENQIFRIFSKVSPLPLVEGQPQSELYDVSDVEAYTVDYFRQSVIFDSKQNEDNFVEIATKFDVFGPINDFDISKITDSNISLRLRGFELTKDKDWSYDFDSGIFRLSNEFNYDDIMRLTVRGVYISDIGKKDHKELEDDFSLESLGLEYNFAGVRDTNFLQSLNRIKRYFEANNLEYTKPAFSGTIINVVDPLGGTNGYIQTTPDLSATYSVGELVGREISFDGCSKKFTIANNTFDNKIYLQQSVSYENFTAELDGSTSTFVLKKDTAISGTIVVYKNGISLTEGIDWVENDVSGLIVSVSLTPPPSPSDTVIISYVEKSNLVLISDFAESGENFEISGYSYESTAKLINIDHGTYKNDIVFDLEDSFIENSVFYQNNDVGDLPQTTFDIYYDSSSNVFYFGTNDGVWKREFGKSIYHKTNPLLSTLDATGSISVPTQLNGAYIQFNKDTGLWTVTWGGGSVEKDENSNLDNISVEAVEVSPYDPNIILLATNDCIFRTLDAGINWECVFHIDSIDRLDNNQNAFRIVFDDKHPWIVNIIFRDGLYRSIDYGSNWDLLSGDNSNDIVSHGGISGFGYQIDDSDSRSVYYYGRNQLFFKIYSENSPISYLKKDHRSATTIDRDALFGIDFVDAQIKKIITDPDNVNEVYFCIENYGMFRTSLLGNSKNINNGSGTYGKSYGFINGSLNSETSGSQKVAALNDILDPDNDASLLGYELYVDTENDRTYVNLDIQATSREIPEDNEFAGKFVRIRNSDKSATKIIEHYDRGPVFGHQYFYDKDGNVLESRRHEFILEGTYPRTNRSFSDAIYTELDNGDYYHALNEDGRPTEMFIPILAESNGGFGPIPLYEFSEKAYVVKSDIFNSGSEETVLIIEDSSVGFATADALQNYIVGDKNSPNKYKIYNSKVLEPSDQFFNTGSQLALRLESIGQFEFDFKDDPYNLWHRYSFADIHKTWDKQIVSIINNDDSVFFSIQIDNVSSSEDFGRQKIQIVTADDFVGKDQNAAYIYWTYTVSDDAALASFKVDGAFSGKHIYNSITGNKYYIHNSKHIDLTHPLYDSDRIGFLLQIEKYESAYTNRAVLYSDGEISSITPSTVTLERSLGLATDTLKGYSLYFDDRYKRSFRITSNTADTITVVSNDLEEIIENESGSYINKANIAYNIDARTSFDTVIDSLGRLFTSTIGYIVMSDDKGRTWKKVIDGLDLDERLDEPFAFIEQLSLVGTYVLGASSTTGGYGGVYLLDTSTLNWSKIGIDSSVKVKSVSGVISGSNIIVYAGTAEDGLYKGVANISSPSTMSWEKIYLPENNIGAIETIGTLDQSRDLDRIWAGTKGRGLFLRNKGEKNWITFEDSNSLDDSIESRLWRVWGIYEDMGFVVPTVLYRTGNNEGLKDVEEYIYNQNFLEEYPLLFDWSKGDKIEGYTDKSYIYLLDPSSSDYILQDLPTSVVSHSTRSAHKFDDYLAILAGSNQFDFKNESVGNALSKMSVGFFGGGETNFYEIPFNHYPDVSSIIGIEQLTDGRILIVTERNGVWRGESDSESIILPLPSGDYTADYGFDYTTGMMTDNPVGNIKAYRFYDGEEESPRFSYELERTIYFDVPNSNSAYAEIDALSNYENLVGGFLIIGIDGLDEVSGTKGDNSYRSYLVQSVTKDLANNRFRFVVTVGKTSSSSEPRNRADWSNFYDRFSESDIPTAQAESKFFFIDFESYEKISDGLPNSELKDSQGNFEKDLLIRDIAMDSLSDACYLACGLKGIYYCSDLSAGSITWESVSAPAGVDVTSIAYADLNDVDGDIFIGTWGDGVWHNIGGAWTNIGPENHKNIWTVFTSQNISGIEKRVFIGTEHGGIYVWNIDTSSFENVSGVIRSQIFLWRTEGVPVLNDLEVFDYSNSNYLLSYSWGGGIMRSLDRGVTWEQFNTGLENMYVQDISIAANYSSKKVAYAATYGGGIFRTDDAFGDSPQWYPCSRKYFPETQNITEVAVGTNPNIVYAKAIENDISLKDIPYRYRKSILYSIRAIDSNAFNDDSSNPMFLRRIDYGNLRDEDTYNYKPFQPFLGGDRKHTIFRSETGGEFWKKIFDKEEGNEANLSSALFGLTSVPGEDDKVHFVSSFFRTVEVVGGQNLFFSRVDFVTVEEGKVVSEVEIPSEFDLVTGNSGPLNPRRNLGEGFVSIDPKNTNVVFLVAESIYDDKKPTIILRSENGGVDWDHRISVTSGALRNGEYGSPVRISTVDSPSEDLILDSDSSPFVLDGSVFEILENNQNFYWRKAKDFYKNSSNRNFQITVSFDSSGTNSNLFRMPSSEPADKIFGARPFFLNGSIIIPDLTNAPNSSFVISNGGHGTFMPSDIGQVDIVPNIRTSFVLSSEYNKDNRPSGTTTARLSGMTSIIYERDSLAPNSILRQENALIGCSVTFDSIPDNSYVIGIHRIYEDGGTYYVQVILIGNLSVSSGDTMTIQPNRALYVTLHNDLFSSVNDGLTWKLVDDSGTFGDPSFDIIGLASLNQDYGNIANSRTNYVLARRNNAVSLYAGIVNDDRYSQGEIENISWTTTALSDQDEYLQGGLAVQEVNSSDQYLYLTQFNKITKYELNSGVIGPDSVVFDSSILGDQVFIQYPIQFSPIDQNVSVFLANNRIFYNLDGFASNILSDEISDFSGDSVRDIRMGLFGNRNIYLSVDSAQSQISVTQRVAFIEEVDGNNRIAVTSISSFLPSEKWIGRPLSFESEDGVISPYITRITGIQVGSIEVLKTLLGSVNSFVYNSVESRTEITFSSTFDFDNGQYVGNNFVIKRSFSENILSQGGVSSIQKIDSGIYKLFVKGDITSVFTSFETTSYQVRIGRVLDYLDRDYNGNAIATILGDQNNNNGIWFSETLEGFERIKDLSYNEIDRPSGLGFYEFSNGSKIAALANDGLIRLMVNDKWFGSSNINSIDISSSTLMISTSNGISIADVSEITNKDLEFNNYYLDEFVKASFLSDGKIYIENSDNAPFIIERPSFRYYGNESLAQSAIPVSGVSDILETSDGIVWYATEDNGIVAVIDDRVIEINRSNSDIGSNLVKDIYLDINGRIWAAFGDNGAGYFNYSYFDGALSTNWVNFNQDSNGFSGSLDAVVQRGGLSYEADGTSDPPSIVLGWLNNSGTRTQSMIIRSEISEDPIVDGLVFDFNAVTGVISAVEEFAADGLDYYRITLSFQVISGIDIDVNTFVGKKILINSRENSEERDIVGNEGSNVIIRKLGDIQVAPEIGKFVMIADKIPGFNSYVIYVGDELGVAPEITDTSIINNSTYYYKLYNFVENSSIPEYNLLDSQSVSIDDTVVNRLSADPIVFIGSNGIYNYVESTRGSSFEYQIGLGAQAGDIHSAFVDSNNVIWISAGEVMVLYRTSAESPTYINKNFMFEDNNGSEALDVRGVVEDASGFKYIATNLGLVIIDPNFRVTSYSAIDSKREGQNSNTNWRPSLSINNNSDFVRFIPTNNESSIYAAFLNAFYITEDYGLTWEEIDFRSDFEHVTPSYDGENIIDYVIVNDNNIYSFAQDSIDIDFIILENLPNLANITQSVPAHSWLSEGSSETDKVLFVGLVDHQITSDEREIGKITLSSDLIGGSISYIGAGQGLSIQSIYSFEYMNVGVRNILFAGGKDNIHQSEDLGNTWSVIPFDSVPINSDQFAYTALSGLNNSSSFEHGDATLFATRTNLYSGGFRNLGAGYFGDKNIVSVRFDESSGVVGGISTTRPLVGRNSSIRLVDGFGFEPYQIYPEFNYNYISGHRGAIKVFENNFMMVGGFNNSLLLYPFLAEKLIHTTKDRSFVYSGRRAFGDSEFPLSVYNDTSSFSSSSSSLLLSELRIRPKSTWCIRFNEDNDSEGYLNIFHFGKNTENLNSKYEYASKNNISKLMTTKDGGMFWQPDTSLSFPNVLVTDMVLDNAEFAISSMISTGENVGVYELDRTTGAWVSDYTSSIPKVPTKEIERVGTDIYAAPLGFGIYKMTSSVSGYGYGYGGQESLDYFDVFGFEGSGYGYAYGYGQEFLGYAQGTEVVEVWEKFQSRFKTEYGLGFGKWNVTAIVQDPANENRVVVGTKNRGVIEGLYDGENWTWIQDDRGLPSGSVTSINLLNTNPFVVLVGIENEGLFIKSQEGAGFVRINSLPKGTVTDIAIDKNVKDIYTSFNFDNPLGNKILIVRSSLEPPIELPEDGVVYVKGDNIFNSLVIYNDSGDFSSVAFKDNDKSLRNGIPYYYRFFYVSVDNEYTEIGTLEGDTSSVNALDFVASTNAFAGMDYSGKIVELWNTLNGNRFYFKIISNTSNTVKLEEDGFGIINRGDATELRSDFVEYTVQSTIAKNAIESNPIYIVLDGDIYESIDNGANWALKNFGIISDVLSVTPIATGAITTLFQTELYAATSNGVYYTSDSGATWSLVGGLPLQSYKKVLVDMEDSNITYAFGEDFYIYRTIDKGGNWEAVLNFTDNINDSSIISDGTNYIFAGFDGKGVRVFEDSIRDAMSVSIEADKRITEFDVDFFERGDKFFTDSNSIICDTIVRNDSITDSREQVTFKVSDDTRYISFTFTKNDILFDTDDIFVGDAATNAYSNPVLLENPLYDQGNIVIHNIGEINVGEVFAITNKGLFTTTNGGDKWVKANSALIPESVLDVDLGKDGEIILGTEEKGLWASKEERAVYRNIEQNGFTVNVVWETNTNGTRRIFRGGDKGLYITVEKPLGRSIIVFSGPTFESGKKIEFSWGDIFSEVDGGWSESTRRRLNIPIIASPSSGKIETYDGWDEALIVRKGPYMTFEKAQSDALANNIFAPLNRIMYPKVRENDGDFTFTSNTSTSNVEEIRDINLMGNGALGVSLDPQAFMSEGNIIVGRLKNNAKEYPSTGNGPTTDKPIVDRVSPLEGASRTAEGMGENFADEDAYGVGEEKIPVLKADRFYIYRVYPYREVPSPDILGVSSGGELFYPTHPRYLPASGDLPDFYSFIIDINKFIGAKSIISASSFPDGNWVVGTDAGVFYSNEEGMNVVKSDVLEGKTPAIFVSSTGLVFVAMSGVTGIEIYKNSKSITNSNFDTTSSWELLTGITQIFREVGVNNVYNFAEDDNGKIYIGTNIGIFEGNSDGTNWARSNTVGDVESIRSGRALGQTFEIT